ncbi:MAG: gamma-glutamyltransferase [Candidatus Omnitrophica bacterium]|nr:gamma-glutamyltransferase [Candidatus Omnitrophota bacterium]
MTFPFRKIFFASSLLVFTLPALVSSEVELVDPVSIDRAANAMVVTADPYATEAALEILEAGGNAVDAAIAAQWVLNVVEPESSGIGGGGFFVYYDSKSKAIVTFDGREKAPARAAPKMFLDEEGNPLPFYPDRITGGLPVGVPGTLKLLKRVHERFGSGNLRFEKLFAPAIELAEEGVPVSKRLAEAIQEEEGRLRQFEASRKIFFHPDGSPLRKDDILVQKDLARTFTKIAGEGIGAFYEGEIARALVNTVKYAPVRPGFLERTDLAFYEAVERDALHGTYRGHDIFTMGPPSSGGVALIEILNILENFSLIFYGPTPDSFHLAIEAQKMAFDDRARHLGDPDFNKIPLKKLLSKDYARKKAQSIKFEEVKEMDSPAEEASLSALGNTSHISIRDSAGNLVSYTTTIEHVFGSAMVVDGWGFVLNNELTDFDAEPGFEGLSGVMPKGHVLASAVPKTLKPNAPGPEKRPRSSMCPVIIFKNGQPFLIAGSPGGSLIIPVVQEIVTNLIDFRLPLEAALSVPRFAARGSAVEVESDFLKDSGAIDNLKRRGHRFVLRKPFGNAQAIAYEKNGGTFVGVSDPRGDGSAKGT